MPQLDDSPPPYDLVVFDCDSTLSTIEGIEELVGDHAEVRALTEAAMDGRVPLEAVYGRRLELARPTRADVERIGALYVEHAVPGARALVAALTALGKDVHVVSGGLLPPVLHFAAWLGIAPERVAAVDLAFDAAGAYADYDRRSPLARAGGKIEVLERLAAGGRALAFVGDGATDLEAAHVARRFVAYGGVARRAAVFAAAPVTCDAPDFRALVPLLLSDDERARLAADPVHSHLVATKP